VDDGVDDGLDEEVVLEAAVVMDVAATRDILYFRGCFLFLSGPLVQAAVIVKVFVVVTSRMGTKLEQKADALRTTSTALQTSTVLRASRCSVAAAETEAVENMVRGSMRRIHNIVRAEMV
jgi:hypothetical protein